MVHHFWSKLIKIFILAALFINVVAAQGGAVVNAASPGINLATSAGKLSYRLAALANSPALRAAAPDAQALDLSVPVSGPGSLMKDAQGRYLVSIRMASLDAASLQQITAAGAQVTGVSDTYREVDALASPAALTALDNLGVVESVQEQLAPMTGNLGAPSTQSGQIPNLPTASCPQGTAVSEGDIQLRANLARSQFPLNGTGVKVGILSDSYNTNTGAVTHAAQDVASGDLPGAANPCGFLTPVTVAQEYSFAGGDEGRAMLQIVHDLAPASTLFFASAFNGLSSFATNIQNLRSVNHADIIADDVFWYIEPFFQEGPVNVAISNVVSQGAVYFTLAGNNNGGGVNSYEAPAYRPAACPTTIPALATGDCHDFDPGSGVSTTNAINLGAGGVLSVDLQWAEPWYGVTTNMDLYLINASNNVVASGKYNNLTTQTPFEFFYYANPGAAQTYRLVINRVAGTGKPRLKYIFLQNTYNVQSIQFNTSQGGDIVGPTLWGHSANRAGASVAAAPYNNNNAPESYSSHGPATWYFGPVTGVTPAAAISPTTDKQPNFTATDGGCTTFFGTFSTGCYRFYGTSAAAPHAAAVAALLKQRANQLGLSFTQVSVDSLLSATARSMSSGVPLSVGAGLIDALGAVQSMSVSPSFYVRKTGADSASCGLQSAPCLTIGKAVVNSITFKSTNPIINIGLGTFNENLSITIPLTLQGVPGNPPATVIDGKATNRVLAISGASVTLNDLVIQNGQIAANGIGAGIQNTGGGSLTLNRVSVRNNHTVSAASTSTGNGGGIYSDGGDLTIAKSTIQGNSNSDSGGGIYWDHGHNLTITGSTLTNNSLSHSGALPNGSGGALTAYSRYPDVKMILQNNAVTGNSALNGGGLYLNNTGSTNPAAISGSTLSGNNSKGPGAALDLFGAVNLTDDTFSDNLNNLASGNGVIKVNALSNVSVDHITLAGSIGPDLNPGYAIQVDGGGSLHVANSILSVARGTSNLHTLCGPSVILSSSGHNLFSETSSGNPNSLSCAGAAASDQNLSAAALLLDTLKDNGGPTQTRALLAGSPAIDHAGTSPLTADQRGIAYQDSTRHGSAVADIGAFEVALKPSLTISTNPAGITPGGTATLKFSAANINLAPATLDTLGFSLDLPAGLDLVGGNQTASFCTGGVLSATAVAGATRAHISFSGGQVPAGAKCDVTLHITGAALGSFPIGPISATTKETGSGPVSNQDVFIIYTPIRIFLPVIMKGK